MSLIPTKKQWQSWALPSKLGAIGTLVTIVAFGAYLVEKTYGVVGAFVNDQEAVADKYEIPEFGFIFLNETGSKAVVQSTGEYQILADLTPMMDTVVENGRFVIGAKIGSKPESETFEVLPNTNISLDGSLVNSGKLRTYFEAGDYKIRFFVYSNGKILRKELPFGEDYLLGELIAVYL